MPAQRHGSFIQRLLQRSSTILCFLAALPLHPISAAETNSLAWPAATRESRPWTRWWWLGSTADPTNLTRQLARFRDAGFGGVEICPIYGAKGSEQQFVPFLSPQWMELLSHTTSEAERLGLGVDMTTGTGWPFGGPNVSADIASAGIVLQKYELAGGETLKQELPAGELQYLVAIPDHGDSVELTARATGRRLDWTAPPGRWRLYAVSQRSPVQQVKRAAPGGVGNVLDPYSVTALNAYLERFDQAFTNYHGAAPRAQFHDSFEYYGATWTRDLFREFQSRRGYDLRTQLPALMGEGPPDTVARVKRDYRETISDLHLQWLQRWTEWCHQRGSLSRDQAHGAPGNLLDLYAAADIPETESYGGVDDGSAVMWRFASSAAHLTGRKLTSAESFTWLNEHFQTSLSQLKPAVDDLFLAGVNHIFFHGIPYSPAEASWPGWQFYAAVNFGPQGGLWRDLPAFNAYVARCQSILQEGDSVNDVLLYFPTSDLFQSTNGLLVPLTMHNVQSAIARHPFYATTLDLTKWGYTFDYVSDQFLAEATCVDGSVVIRGKAYRTVLVSGCRVMPGVTMTRLTDLAERGAMILFRHQLPEATPGLRSLEQGRQTLTNFAGNVWIDAGGDVRRRNVGKGGFIISPHLPGMLSEVFAREPCVEHGLQFIRRSHARGLHYFLVNRRTHAIDDWVPLGTNAQSAVILDPRFENQTGRAALRSNGIGATEIYLQLQPGESCIVRTFNTRLTEGPEWRYVRRDINAHKISGVWQVRFIEGGPKLPPAFSSNELGSWTARDDSEARRFAGTALYTLEFEHPAGAAGEWLLDLGRVCESARVRLNGRDVGTLWCQPFELRVGQFLKPGTNTLEVEVTNLAANRIADLDRRKVNWKYFYDANVMSKGGRALNASNWPLFDSGLLGPVTLRAVDAMRPQP